MTRRRSRWPLVLALSAMAYSAPAYADLRIDKGALVEDDGAPLVLRGVNQTHAWTPKTTRRALRDISETGANAVRVALGAGAMFERTTPADVARIVAEAKRRKLVVMLAVHDTTGYPDNEKAVPLGDALGYWASLRGVLAGEEDYVLVNIGNEPSGPSATAEHWRESHLTAIRALRAMGYRHTIVVDAPGYGQDAQKVMPRAARALFEADPLKNLLFSVHMYEVYGDSAPVRAYLQSFRDQGLPLVIGEFGGDHNGKPVDEDAILAIAQEMGVGWLAWSWDGNGAQAANLDMVEDWDPTRRTPWGARVIAGENGIEQTSRRASVFAKRRWWGW